LFVEDRKKWIISKWHLCGNIFNAFWMSIDADHNDADIITEAEPLFFVVENIFCAYFFGEILIRFLAFKYKRSCFKDNWFIFDGVLVSLMVLETWVIIILDVLFGFSFDSFLGNLSILRIFRLAKILRMARLVRLLRAFPEIILFLRGIQVAARSVAVVITLWLIIVYVYGMVFRLLTKSSNTADPHSIGEKYFETVPQAMITLLIDGIFPGVAPIAHQLSDEENGGNFIIWLVFISFVTIAVVTVANLLIGVMVSVVGIVAEAEKEGIATAGFNFDLRNAMRILRRDETKKLTKKDFSDLLQEPEIGQVVHGIGVDVVGLLNTVDLIFENKQATEISFEEFISICLDMRGNNQAKVRDIKVQLKSMRQLVQESKDQVIEQLDEKAYELHNSIQVLAMAGGLAGLDEDDEDDELSSNDTEDSPAVEFSERSEGFAVAGGVSVQASAK